MSEKIQDKTVYSLLEVTESIRRTLNDRYASAFWVKAEMNKLNHYTHSGHCYPELLEKREGKIVAQIRANLWKEDYIRSNDNFLKVLKEPLKDGISILFFARISFDPVYGLALRILEIDPVYSLGELEREKQETIDRLNREGIFGANKQLHLALVPQRIAVISVETSKGFADFRKMIETSSWGYCFFFMLFPSLLQGEKVAESVGNALERIRRVMSHFDAVAIIRGGGGDIGLAGYNHYELARQVALFPLPVITGIGHATNETVTEMVSYRNCITPTELAGFLIQQFHNFAVPVKEAQQLIHRESRRMLTNTGDALKKAGNDFRTSTLRCLSLSSRNLILQAANLKGYSGFLIRGSRNLMTLQADSLQSCSIRLMVGNRVQLTGIASRLQQTVPRIIQQSKHGLGHLEQQLIMLDPKRVLARGYSITRLNGTAIRAPQEVTHGDMIETTVYKGIIQSVVKKK